MGRSRGLSVVVVVVVLTMISTTLCLGASVADDCTTDGCSPDGPEIRFPFWKRGRPPRCGYGTGFELFCRGNETVVELPFSGQFPVTSISYEQQRLHLHAGSCPVATFFNLNLSGSPFELHEALGSGQQGYMLLNCSSGLPVANSFTAPYWGFFAMGCLDGFGRRFFAVGTHALRYLNEACVSMRTVPVPQAFVFRLCGGDGARYDPSIHWGSPDCSTCEAAGGLCRWNTSNQETACFHTPLPPRPGGRTKSTIIGVSVGASILILALATITKLFLSWKWKRDKETENQRKIEKFLEDYKSLNPMRYSYVEIKRITNQFKTKLGEGGYGGVFKGVLPNGVEVAVKVLRRTVGGGGEEFFVNEVRTIGRIHHVNIVRLLGFCADGNKRALIYEFMPNESLEKFTFPRDHGGGGGGPPMLGWAKLHEIAVGVARGIEYLHQGCDQRILHFDIKPHNILLDRNFRPRISDFGLAKLCSKEQSAVSMTAARGTPGYIAPEVASRNVGSVSYKSDVYSFGMLLLEMVGGRKNIHASADHHPSQTYFPEWVYNRMHQGLELGLHITGDDQDGGAANTARILAITALWCIQWYPVDRPSMKSVVQMLEGSVESLTMPPNPFVTTVGRMGPSDSSLQAHDMSLATISESETDENI